MIRVCTLKLIGGEINSRSFRPKTYEVDVHLFSSET
jgi:hypothetical protein